MSGGWRVVVGFDGSDAARAALAWAASDAASRGLPLHLVHGVTPPVPSSGMSYAVPVDLDVVDALRSGAQELLDTTAAGLEPVGVTVTTEVAVGSATTVLLDAAEDAALVVVGSRGLGGFRGLLLGSVGVQVATHAPCPVVVVRTGDVHADGPVVVGLDGSPLGHAALAFAFEHASRRGLRLVVVHAWEIPAYDLLAAPAGPPPVSLTDLSDTEVRLAAEALAGFGERYPDVEVEERLVKGPAARTLLEAAADASLLVVGSRGRGELVGALLGSVSHAVLHHAEVPVAVVHQLPPA